MVTIQRFLFEVPNKLQMKCGINSHNNSLSLVKGLTKFTAGKKLHLLWLENQKAIVRLGTVTNDYNPMSIYNLCCNLDIQCNIVDVIPQTHTHFDELHSAMAGLWPGYRLCTYIINHNHRDVVDIEILLPL